tara:strand:+ start:42 stop:440 length:399 start_codon:yes stop_codon:yes gene_type:complete
MKPKTYLLILLSLFLTFSCDIKTDIKIGDNTETYHQIDKQGTITIDTKLKYFNNDMVMNIRFLEPKPESDHYKYLFFSSDSFLLFTYRKYYSETMDIYHKWKNSDGSVDEIYRLSIPISKEVYNEIDYWIIE